MTNNKLLYAMIHTHADFLARLKNASPDLKLRCFYLKNYAVMDTFIYDDDDLLENDRREYKRLKKEFSSTFGWCSTTNEHSKKFEIMLERTQNHKNFMRFLFATKGTEFPEDVLKIIYDDVVYSKSREPS